VKRFVFINLFVCLLIGSFGGQVKVSSNAPSQGSMMIGALYVHSHPHGRSAAFCTARKGLSNWAPRTNVPKVQKYCYCPPIITEALFLVSI